MKKLQFRNTLIVLLSLNLIVFCDFTIAQNIIRPVGKMYFNPSFSSSGNRILFQGNISGASKIFTCDIYGGDLKSVINDSANYFNPVWGQDSNTVLFTSDRSGQYDLFKYRIDSNIFVNLTNSSAFDEDYPSYTRNKNSIVFFQATRNEYYEELGYSYKNIHFTISDTAGKNQHRISGERPLLSPDGMYFVTTKGNDRNTFEIWLYSLERKIKRMITNGHYPIAWTPNGNSIIYNDLNDNDDHLISIINIDGTGKKIIFKKYYCYLDNREINSWNLWDPTCSYICLPITMHLGYMDHNGLVILDTLGNIIRDLRETNQVYNYGSNVSWSPDGKMITFSKNQQYPNPWQGGIYTIKSDGTELKIIVQDEVSYKSK